MSRFDDERPLPAHITIPGCDSYQVRIVRDGHEYSASFNWAVYGKARALREAEKWRDATLLLLPQPGNAPGSFRSQPLSNKVSWDRVGVSCSVSIGRMSYIEFIGSM